MGDVAQDTFAALIGASVERCAAGNAQAKLIIGPNHLNPHGTAHGAVLYSLAGVAIAASINDETTSGIVWSASIDYVAPGRLGDELVAEAVVEPLADKHANVIVTITRPSDGVVVATSLAKAKIRPRAAG
jgi:acyl-CoA thioesterase